MDLAGQKKRESQTQKALTWFIYLKKHVFIVIWTRLSNYILGIKDSNSVLNFFYSTEPSLSQMLHGLAMVRED